MNLSATRWAPCGSLSGLVGRLGAVDRLCGPLRLGVLRADCSEAAASPLPMLRSRELGAEGRFARSADTGRRACGSPSVASSTSPVPSSFAKSSSSSSLSSSLASSSIAASRGSCRPNSRLDARSPCTEGVPSRLANPGSCPGSGRLSKLRPASPSVLLRVSAGLFSGLLAGTSSGSISGPARNSPLALLSQCCLELVDRCCTQRTAFARS
mmetsp:Transcript_33112/g.94952  ORF Transcript_33112/g.94952 Transcript_33112/m.94952 type:complete len:211 (-) Transcript_33112:358-990(-)